MPPAPNTSSTTSGSLDHGIGDEAPSGCEESLRVGVPLRDAVLCIAHEDPLRLGDGRSLIVGHVLVAEGAKLRRVLRIPVGAGPLWSEGLCAPSCAQHYYVRVELVPSADGATIVARDSADPAESCATAAERRKLVVDMPPRFASQTRDLEQMACDARGVYRWRGHAFEKVRGFTGEPRPSTGRSGP